MTLVNLNKIFIFFNFFNFVNINSKAQNNNYSAYNKSNVQNDVINKGWLLQRIDKIERCQFKLEDFGKDVDLALDGIQQRITNQLLNKSHDSKPSVAKIKLK